METFTQTKPFVNNHDFELQRKRSLKKLDFNSIDEPIVDIIKGFSKRNYCFTLQSCYGHFIHDFQNNKKNIEPLPLSYSGSEIEYRIAYIAFCIESSEPGKAFLNKLQKIQRIDENYIQFGCADWFWQRHLNSFVLQVEPERFKYEDKIMVDYAEAVHIEKVRNIFFSRIRQT